MTTKEKIKVMQAFVDGKQIQFKSKDDIDWQDLLTDSISPEPIWSWEKYDYRVKPELEYTPYKNTDEMIKDYCERFGIVHKNYEMPIIWVASKNLSKNENIKVNDKKMIMCFEDESVFMIHEVGVIGIYMANG